MVTPSWSLTEFEPVGHVTWLRSFFSPLTGARSSVIGKMKDEVQRIYSTLVTRVHRKPRTAPNDELPVLIGAADLSVYKRDRSAITPVFCNGGLHFHLL